MCGEQLSSVFACWIIWGSPPRVRGTAGPPNTLPRSGRITPACAGNSQPGLGFRGGLGDHPRVCGEQFLAYPPKQRYKGSPPRVRGTALSGGPAQRRVRITPACAGNSSIQAARKGFLQDHPRVCGEQTYSVVLSRTIPGSPPRVRGTVTTYAKFFCHIRITPACAGNRR